MGLEISSLHVRRSIFIEAPVGRVWQEFTSFDRIAAWFGRGHTLHRFDLEVGGQVELSVEDEGVVRRFGGPVLVLDPEREVSFASDWFPKSPYPVPTLFTIRIAPLYDGTLGESAEPIVDKRYLEICLVVVSELNACDYCVAHHAPRLVEQGLSADTVQHILEPDCPGLDEVDRLVRDYAVAVTNEPGRIRDAMFERLRALSGNGG